MAGVLSGLRRLFKRRKHERYAVMQETFVVITPKDSIGDERKVQLIDISQGGMAFIYQGPSTDLEASGVLKLLTQREIDFETVCDTACNCSPTSEPLRRRGVKFKWMGPFERGELSNLIREISTFEK